jgi:hypothetical protein
MQQTVENKAAEVLALVDELNGYERRVAASSNDADRDKWTGRIEQVREQLAVRGAEGRAPVRRASKRLGPEAEQR